MKYFPKLKGDKVYLSPINLEDLEKYTQWINDLEVSILLGMGSSVCSLNSEQEILERMVREKYAFAIISKEKDELLGNCRLQNVNLVHGTAELGIFIGEKENRGKGYGTEALQLILEFAFKVLNLHNVMLKVYSFNKRACKAYEKVGFTEIGRRKEAYRLNNRWYDVIYYQILSSDLKSNFLTASLPGE